MLQFETYYRQQGKSCIAGIDEVGRGPLAGPVVACAVVLPVQFNLDGVNDSKKLSELQRETVFQKLIAFPDIHIGVGFVSQTVIDTVNILNATKIAMREAVYSLPYSPDHLLIDGLLIEDLPISQTKIIKGDSRSLSIASASIIAKVIRDRVMYEYDGIYPDYKFVNHKGYGTREHVTALRSYGLCPLHRKTFAPVRECVLKE